MEQQEIDEIISEIKGDLDSYAAVGSNTVGAMIVNKNTHAIKIMDDLDGYDQIIKAIIELGVEILPSYDILTKKYVARKVYPIGFPKEKMDPSQ